MKKTLPALILILCLALGACTAGGTLGESASFLCPDAQSCAVVGDKLILARRGGVKCLDLEGNEVFESALSQLDAAVSASAAGAIAYCVGGNTVVFDDAETLTTDNAIVSASLSDCGMAAVCTFEPGYKGAVTVYSAEKSAVYKWYSALGEVTCAQVSPDGGQLAVCAENKLHLLCLDGKSAQGEYDCPEELRAIAWLDGAVCGIGSGGVYFLSSDGVKSLEHSFGDGITGKYGVLDGRLIIEVREDEKSRVCILSEDAETENEIKLQGSVLGMDCSDDRILILTHDTVGVYDRKGRLVSTGDASGVSEAMLLDGGRVLTVGGGTAKILQNDR